MTGNPAPTAVLMADAELNFVCGCVAGEMGLGTGMNHGHVIGMNPAKPGGQRVGKFVSAKANEFFPSRTSDDFIRDMELAASEVMDLIGLIKK